MKVLDTTFLIDLQRELAAGEPGPAQQFLTLHEDDEFAISVISMLEFLEGYERTKDGEDFLEPFVRLEVNENVCRIGSRVRRYLRRQGKSIGDFDILIAATALEAEAELVTSDRGHFERVPQLRLVNYM
ncbi:MAG: type II toxin-antitoxin system VapC family toxin [Acidobacteriota bacterium]